MKTLILYLIYSLIIFPNVPSTAITAPTVEGVEVVSRDPIVDLVNKVREENGCKNPLKENTQLIKAAEERADWVAADHWTHDGNWKTINKYYHYHLAGENMARGWPDDQAVVNAWLESKTHREVMLNCSYVETGIGRSGSYIIQLFGKR